MSDLKSATNIEAYQMGKLSEQNRIIALLTIKYAELIKANQWKDSNYYLEIVTLIREETK